MTLSRQQLLIVAASVLCALAALLAFPHAAAASSPVVEATDTSTDDATTHAVSLPASIQAGDVLVVVFTWDAGGGQGISTPAGWDLEGTVAYADEVGGDVVGMAIFSKTAVGDEGTTVSITTTADGRSNHHSYRISGASGNVEATTPAVNSGGDGNPPNITPSWGAADILVIVANGVNNETGSLTALPTNYTDALQSSDTYMDLATGRRSMTAASSEDPGVFNWSGGNQWLATTIAIEPEAAEPETPPRVIRLRGTIRLMGGTHLR